MCGAEEREHGLGTAQKPPPLHARRVNEIHKCDIGIMVYMRSNRFLRMLKMSAYVKRQATSLILYVFSRNVCARRAHENSPFLHSRTHTHMPSSARQERWSPLARKRDLAYRHLSNGIGEQPCACWLSAIQQNVTKPAIWIGNCARGPPSRYKIF